MRLGGDILVTGWEAAAGRRQQGWKVSVSECCQDPEMETRYWVRIVSVCSPRILEAV